MYLATLSHINCGLVEYSSCFCTCLSVQTDTSSVVLSGLHLYLHSPASLIFPKIFPYLLLKTKKENSSRIARAFHSTNPHTHTHSYYPNKANKEEKLTGAEILTVARSIGHLIPPCRSTIHSSQHLTETRGGYYTTL